jgi:hypothetical protein
METLTWKQLNMILLYENAQILSILMTNEQLRRSFHLFKQPKKILCNKLTNEQLRSPLMTFESRVKALRGRHQFSSN